MAKKNKDYKRYLSQEDSEYLKESETLTRIVQAIIDAAEEDKESLRASGREAEAKLKKAKDELEKTRPTTKKAQEERRFVLDWLNETLSLLGVSNKRQQLKVQLKKLAEYLTAVNKEKADAELRNKGVNATLQRQTAVTAEKTKQLYQLKRMYQAKSEEVDKLTESNLSLEEKAKRVDALEKEMQDLVEMMDEEIAKLKGEEEEIFRMAQEEVDKVKKEGEEILAEAFNEIERLSLSNKGLRAQYDRELKKSAEKTKEIKKLEIEKKRLEDEYSKLNKSNTLERTRLAGKIQELEGQIREATDTNERLNARLASLRVQIIIQEIYKTFGVEMKDVSDRDLNQFMMQSELRTAVKNSQKLVGPDGESTRKSKHNKLTASNYDYKIDTIVKNLAELGINISKDKIDRAIKIEVEGASVVRHPIKAWKAFVSKDEQGNYSLLKDTRKSIGYRLFAGLGIITVLVGGVASLVTTLSVNYVNEKDNVTATAIESSKNLYSNFIEQGAKYVNLKSEQADKLVESVTNSNTSAATRAVSYNGDSTLEQLHGVVKDIANNTSDIISFNADGTISQDCKYAIALNNYEQAKADGNFEAMQQYVNELGNYASVIGHSSEMSEESAGVETYSNVEENASSYCNQINDAYTAMDDYIRDQYKEVYDSVMTPVYDVEFSQNDIKNYQNDLLADKVGRVTQVLNCTYERETGNVNILVQVHSNAGDFVVQKSFTMTPMLSNVSAQTIMNAYSKTNAQVNVFNSTLNTNVSGDSVKMSVDGKEVQGNVEINYTINVENFENGGKAIGNAIVMVKGADGKVVAYKTYEYSTNFPSGYTESELKDQILNKLINNINNSLNSNIEVTNDIDIEAE